MPSMNPAGPPITTMAGDAWNFQGWHPDMPAGARTSNFTHGLSKSF